MAVSPQSSIAIHDQMSELQRKIQLLESDRTACYEISQATIQKNSETIRMLRQENRKLLKEQADITAGDDHIIKIAFHNRGLEKLAYRNMTGKTAVTTLKQRVLYKEKQLNALKHTTETYQSRLGELLAEYQRQKPGGASGPMPEDHHALKKEMADMNIRQLENRLEKSQLKDKEAENIMLNYQKLKNHLQDESLTFQGQLNGLESEILKHREELYRLQLVHKDAQLSKDDSKGELHHLEERLCRERKERERIIGAVRKQIEERKAQSERYERKAVRAVMESSDELSSETHHSASRVGAEEEKALSPLEAVYRNIKEATGVTTMQEIVDRFGSQKDTHQHLENLKVENEAVLLQLNEQMELLNHQMEALKYSGEAKHSSDQETVTKQRNKLQAQQQSCDAAKERLDWLSKTLTAARTGVEHLKDKLQHITVSADTKAGVELGSDEFVVELVKQCELKLQALHSQLQGTDMATVRKEMHGEEFLIRIEGKLPECNTRVKLPDDQTQELTDDEDAESEGDEGDMVTREALKRQSLQLIDSHHKKKPWKKKKGKF